ncbi:MAG: gluconate 2-dehydrogenase subunit 3 family protein [Flavobacteriaceae bacterium]|nr:gluconate 2-dehydrogenase subunit 3 family protein [Flavobacteriaceae bacterium]
MKRRKALKKIGLSLGTITLTPTVIGLFHNCQSEIDWNPKFFKIDQIEYMSKMLDIIIPKTSDVPGAYELNLVRYIDTFASIAWNEQAKDKSVRFLNTLITNTQNVASKSSISKITTADYENQLKKFLMAEDHKTKEWNNLLDNKLDSVKLTEEAMAYKATISLRDWGVRAFKLNEYIGENILDYRPIPGEHKGCVDLQEATGGIAYSL